MPEKIIDSHCEHHEHGSTCHGSGEETAPGSIFFGPVLCLLMLLVGVGIEQLSPAYELETAQWPPGRMISLMAFLVAFVAGGTQITGHAFGDLRSGRITIDFLMILAAVGSAAIGDWAEGAILLFLFSLSHSLEHYVLGRTRRAIRDLMQLTPDDAIVLRNGQESRVRVEQLVVCDTVLVQPSSRIPADGVVTSGQTSIDQSPMTGESIPVDKRPGDAVFAGTLNQQGSIQMEVTRVSSETTLARMVELVEEAQSTRTESQRFTDWFGQRYTWIVLTCVLVALLIGISVLGEPFTKAFYRAMTLLVVISPCAVVISIPSAILAGITSAARGGVLFKGGSHLEQTARLRAMAFDKTGTLTLGRARVVDVVSVDGISEAELLSAAAALECHSEHPLARAIVEAAVDRGIAFQRADDVQSFVGRGIEGTTIDQRLHAGKLDWFREAGIAVDEELAAQAESFQANGQTAIFVGNDHRTWGLIVLADTIQPTAIAAVDALRDLKISPLIMLSGDHAAVAQRIAAELGIEYQGGLLPEDKLRIIQSMREKYGTVGMIGDGMNDAPSLAAANVGFSLGGAGTDVALETADVILLADDLRRLPYAIAIARRTRQIIFQNLVLSFSVMGLLLLTTLVVQLPLPLAVCGHEGSTVAVILNGLRLLAFPRPASLASGTESAQTAHSHE